MDEAYADDADGMVRLINAISNLKKTKILFGWRREHLAKNETETLRAITCDTISLSAWDDKMAQIFVCRYAEIFENSNITSKYEAILRNNDAIRDFIKNPFQLTLLVYLLENQEYPDISQFLSAQNQTLYNLYKVFWGAGWKKRRVEKQGYFPIHKSENNCGK